jgi:hypothetical protein
MAHAVSPAARAVTPVRRTPLPGFHLGLALLMTGVVLLGFWPFYAGLLRGRVEAHPLILVHAAVFSGWMALLLVQTWLVFRRRVGTHMRLGRAGIVYGIGLLALGVVTALAAPPINVAAGRMTVDEGASFLLLAVGDMVLVGIFLVAGIRARRDREVHRRMMVLAAVAMIFPGAARFAFAAGPLAVAAVWLLPLAAAMAHDLWASGRVHRAYWIGLAILLAGFARVAVMETEAWLAVGRPIIHAMTGGAPAP